MNKDKNSAIRHPLLMSFITSHSELYEDITELARRCTDVHISVRSVNADVLLMTNQSVAIQVLYVCGHIVCLFFCLELRAVQQAN